MASPEQEIFGKKEIVSPTQGLVDRSTGPENKGSNIVAVYMEGTVIKAVKVRERLKQDGSAKKWREFLRNGK